MAHRCILLLAVVALAAVSSCAAEDAAQLSEDYEKINSLLVAKAKELDQVTYRNVLALASSYYLPEEKLGKLVSETREKEVNEDFTVPAIMEFAKESIVNKDTCPRLAMVEEVDAEKLFEIARAMSAGTEDAKYLVSHVDKESGHFVYEDGIKDLLERYFFKPCSNYLSAFGELGMEDYHHVKRACAIKGNFVEDLSCQLLNRGYSACKLLNASQEKLLDSFEQGAVAQFKINFKNAH